MLQRSRPGSIENHQVFGKVGYTLRVTQKGPRSSSKKAGFQLLLLALLILAIGPISLSLAQPGRADGGGWPTPSPTFILFPTITPQATTEPYPKALPPQLLPQGVLPSPTFFLPTPVPDKGFGSSFVCWPFALALILIVILGSTVIFRRVKT